MDDSQIGTRNARDEWKPNARLKIAPFYKLPPDMNEMLAWVPHYFLPWNIPIALSAVAYWAFALPPVEQMATLSAGWILKLLLINLVAVAVFYGFFEFRLYMQRAQKNRFKYNPVFPADRKSKVFWFANQNVENILRTFLFGVTVWTAMEVFVLWQFAKAGLWQTNPWIIGLIALFVPVIHQAHFYCIHRLIHTPFLYKWVHSIHHRSINPSPWSSLAMHPVEHALYFASMLWHLVLPSNPVLAIYQLHYAGFGAIPGHMGFDRVEIGEDKAFDPHAYGHYLHHKYFEVNYGDGLVPFDKLFGTYHDGSEEAAQKMRERLRAKAAKRASA